MHPSLQRRSDALAELQRSAGAQLDEAAARLVETLASGGRILLIHDREAAPVAQALLKRLVLVIDTERPPLPVCLLGASDEEDNELMQERHLQALASAGDCLIACAGGRDSRAMAGAINLAHAQHLNMILIDHARARPDRSELWGQDVELCVAAEGVALIQEQQLIIAHCLCEAIDQQLFGAPG